VRHTAPCHTALHRAALRTVHSTNSPQRARPRRAVYLNGRNDGKHGIEAIPHIRYWEEVPGLVREGVQFSYVHGRAAAEVGLERGKVAYSLVKERYANQGAS
jgi:hypothetical protein